MKKRINNNPLFRTNLPLYFISPENKHFLTS